MQSGRHAKNLTVGIPTECFPAFNRHLSNVFISVFLTFDHDRPNNSFFHESSVLLTMDSGNSSPQDEENLKGKLLPEEGVYPYDIVASFP